MECALAGPSDKEDDAAYQGFGDTILKGIKQITGSEPEYYLGTDIQGKEYIDIKAIVQAAEQANKIVFGLGENSYAKEFGNIGNLTLPAKQLDLVSKIAEAALNKPIVIILV
ncbi:hypothetical protein H4R20_000289 [Coemansia guatemalensis]|uniref:Glycoside hydrolase n=1 Tax=Coemansia guatemalensis TaxID=2761395 RepID=A0A9W8LX31_9FUNG|nr:hypothetical protein H4R20_000289 [Coemansia guatemalensis]